MLSAALANGFINNVQKSAVKIIKKDRDRFDNVVNIILEYVKENKLILSDVNKLINHPDPTRRKISNIYCVRALYHANNIANIIHEKISNGKWTRMKSISRHLYAVEYDSRIMCYVNQLESPTNVNITQLTNFVTINNTMYLPQEIEIIDYYHMMYSPSRFNEWDPLTGKELFTQIHKRIEEKKIGKIGGSKSLMKFKNLVYNYLKIPECSAILMGYWVTGPSTEKIQILHDESDSFKQQLITYLSNIDKYSVTSRKQNMYLPKDSRLTRYTFYVRCDGKDRAFLDLYDSVKFELIPYRISDNINIASKYVSMRFMFIDLWIIRLIASMGLIDEHLRNKKISIIWKKLIYFNDYVDGKLDYIGTNFPAELDNKLKTLGSKGYYPYYPESYFQSHGKLREIK